MKIEKSERAILNGFIAFAPRAATKTSARTVPHHHTVMTARHAQILARTLGSGGPLLGESLPTAHRM
jgi:hypothetical protein